MFLKSFGILLIVLLAVCVQQGSTSDRCRLPMKVGPCRASMERWYYNTKTKSCDIFYYGGCQGNANRFKTLSACRNACP